MLTGIFLSNQYNRDKYCGYCIVKKYEHKIYKPIELFNELLLIANVSERLLEFYKKMTLEVHLIDNKIEKSISKTLEIKNDPCFNDIDWISLENGRISPPFIPNKVFIIKF